MEVLNTVLEKGNPKILSLMSERRRWGLDMDRKAVPAAEADVIPAMTPAQPCEAKPILALGYSGGCCPLATNKSE